MDPHRVLLSAAFISLAYLLYRKRNSNSCTSSPLQQSDKPGYILHEPAISPTFVFPQDPNYLPFRGDMKGKLRMGVKRMNADEWIEIDNTFEEQIRRKKPILKEQHPLVWISKESANTEKAKREVLDMLVDYLPTHFPDIYKLRDGYIHNNVTGDSWRVVGKLDVDPFEIANLLIQEDMVLLEQEDDKLVVTAGCVCFPMRWNVKDKFLQNLPIVHDPVPPFEKQLAPSVMKLLLDLKPDYPIWRSNWSIMHDLNGENILFLPHASESTVKLVDPEALGDQVLYRVERQTLRRLPKSNAILFTIRTYQKPLKEVAKQTEVIPQLISAIENMEPGMRLYKGRELWMDAVLEYLRRQMK